MPVRLPIETVQSWLKQCPVEREFVCINGQRARSIKDLVKILERINSQNYKYHVNKDKNDFAAWVEGVFHNGHLAANFRSARSIKEAYQYCKRHHAMLERNVRDYNIKQDRKKQRQAKKNI